MPFSSLVKKKRGMKGMPQQIHLDDKLMYVDYFIDTTSRYIIFLIQSQRHLPSWSSQILSYRSKKIDFFFNPLAIHLLLFMCERSNKKFLFLLMRKIFNFNGRFLRNGNFCFNAWWANIKNLHMHAWCSAAYFFFI